MNALLRPFPPMLRHMPPLPLLIAIVALSGYGCSPYELRVGRRCPEGAQLCDAPIDGGSDGAGEGSIRSTPESGNTGIGWDRSDAGDVGPTETPKRNHCVPGYYKGEYSVPTYKATPAGLCGIITPPGGGPMGQWEFRLPDVGEIGEADVMPITTCLEFDAVPAGVGLQLPQRIRTEFTGSLDCGTGQLTGLLKGAYYSEGLCDRGEQAWYSIKAFLSGAFDPDRLVFAGRVDIREQESLLPLPGNLDRTGGEGVWWAGKAPGDVGDAPTEGCLEGVEFSEFEVSR